MIVQYQALDKRGGMVADALTVETTADAVAELKRQGLTPIRIEARAEQDAGPWWWSWRGQARSESGANPGKASRKHLLYFTTQMAILLETGTPLAASLASVEHQMTCPHWRALVARLRQSVEEGSTLAGALSQFPRTFAPVYASMIGAGERSGNLKEIFERLSSLERLANRLRGKVTAAMVYPVLLMSIAAAVMVVLIFFVLPRFEAMFEQMGVTVPSTTQFMLSVSHWVRGHVLLTLLLVGTAAVTSVLAVLSPPGQRLLALYALRAPIVGPLVRSVNLARIFRLWQLLINSSLPLLDTLDLTEASTRNYLYAELIHTVREHVIDGQPMWQVLQRSWLVTPGLAQMVRTGEENGRLAQVVGLLADHLDEENDTKVGMLTSIMEPVILVFMGIVVGTVAMSLVLPMFDLSQVH